MTLGMVGGGNLLLGLGIWLVGRRRPDAPPREPVEADAAPPPKDGQGPLVALALLSGLVSLGFEISLDWLIRGLITVSAAELAGVAPIREELPIYEYTVDPFSGLLPSARRPARAPAPPAS
jgi:hypothetical protein